MADKAPSIEYLWTDKKRHLGLPISFTRYSMSEDRLFLETGLLNLKVDEILLYRVRDISLSMTLGQRIFGVGSVIVKSTDKTIPDLELRNIKQPRDVKEMIHKQVEAMKEKRKMRVGEIMGEGDGHYDDLDDGIY